MLFNDTGGINTISDENIQKITEFARTLGFRVMWDGNEWANFNIEATNYSIKVKYDYSKRFFKDNIIYFTASTDLIQKYDDIKKFNDDTIKAALLMDKLTEIANRQG